MMWQRQLFGIRRGGGRFQLEPRWNRAGTSTALISLANSRGSSGSSFAPRVMRVRLCVCTCAYTRGVNLGTVEPASFLFINQRVRGSIAVPRRFQLGTAAVDQGALVVAVNILAGGYAGEQLLEVADRAASGLGRARGGETFGDFRAAGDVDLVPIGADPELLGLVVRNGGFPPFPGCSIGHVGRAMLEGYAQRRGNAGVVGTARKPRRLERGALAELEQLAAAAPGTIAQATPLCPHPRRARALAWSRPTLAGFGSAIPIPGSGTAGPRGRQGSAPRTGRGEPLARVQSAQRGAGRGENGAAWVAAPRRISQASGRPGGVN